MLVYEESSDVNKATGHEAKAKDFQHSPRPGQGQGQTHPRPDQGQGHTATVRDQIKTSDVTYLLHSITAVSYTHLTLPTILRV